MWLSSWDPDDYGRYQIREVTASLSSTPLSVALNDPMRVALIVSLGTAGSPASISTLSKPTAGQGIGLTSTQPTVYLTYDSYGPLVCQQWFGIAAAATTVTVITYTLIHPEDLPWVRRSGQPANRVSSSLMRRSNSLALPGSAWVSGSVLPEPIPSTSAGDRLRRRALVSRSNLIRPPSTGARTTSGT